MFEWDGANADHLLEHGVSPDEAEEALADPRRRPAAAYQVEGQPKRYAVIGATETRRVLFVVYHRIAKQSFRVISARDADRVERRRYRRK
jgi:uncharacterized protein